VPKCCRKGVGYDFKRQRILKKISWQKKWSGHGLTGRTADYSPAHGAAETEKKLYCDNNIPIQHKG